MTWADDNLLLATSVAQLKEMWAEAKLLLEAALFNIGEDDAEKCAVLNKAGKRSTEKTPKRTDELQILGSNIANVPRPQARLEAPRTCPDSVQRNASLAYQQYLAKQALALQAGSTQRHSAEWQQLEYVAV